MSPLDGTVPRACPRRVSGGVAPLGAVGRGGAPVVVRPERGGGHRFAAGKVHMPDGVHEPATRGWTFAAAKRGAGEWKVCSGAGRADAVFPFRPFGVGRWTA